MNLRKKLLCRIDDNCESKAPKEVVYNEKYPPEFFDVIIVDECHRSIYNVWSQVLSYFDAFIVEADCDTRTIGHLRSLMKI